MYDGVDGQHIWSIRDILSHDVRKVIFSPGTRYMAVVGWEEGEARATQVAIVRLGVQGDRPAVSGLRVESDGRIVPSATIRRKK